MATYTSTISWNNDSPETFTKNQYSRGHEWAFDGGVTVPASSSPHVVRLPYSIEANVDPEEALIASASSCHMLSFLYLAARAGFNALSYEDKAVGEMAKRDDGKEWMAKIVLDPQIDWAEGFAPDAERLAELHHEAHDVCYIANSLKTEIVVKNLE